MSRWTSYGYEGKPPGSSSRPRSRRKKPSKAPMTDRTEPSDKPAEEKADKPDRDEIEKLAVWLFEKFPLAGYHPPSKFKNLKPYQKNMMIAYVEKLLANFVPRSEHERIVGDLRDGLERAFLTDEQFRQMPEEDRIAINDVLTKRGEVLARKRMELGLDRDDPACCG